MVVGIFVFLVAAAQLLDVDSITGATISTRTILAAVGNALTQQ
jgi:uncharacterized protein with FMN-binding domain